MNSDHQALLAFADRVEEACKLASHCNISVSDAAIEVIRDVVAKAERYDWLAAHPTAFVSNYSGKYRVNIGDYLVTEWFDTREEAIDSARAVENEE